MIALALRILRQLRRDPRSLALAFLAPLFLMWVLSLFLAGGTIRYDVGMVGRVPQTVRAAIERQDLRVRDYAGKSQALSALRLDSVEAFIIWQPDSLPTIWLQGADPQRTQTVRLRLSQALGDVSAAPLPRPRVRYLYGGPNLSMISYFLPALLGVFLFFFAYLLSGITFLRERSQGTLERLLRTPLRAGSIVGGYFLAFALIAAVQAVLVLWLVFGPLGAVETGPMWLLGLIAVLVSLGGVVLGLLLSAAAHTEFQVIQFVPLVIIPQLVFSGLFPLQGLPRWLQDIGTIIPMSYAVDAVRKVAIEGRGLGGIEADVLVLLGFVIAVGGANALLLARRQRG